ncbi:hypothetical protein HYH02_011020 [Chlamydomonas schloesseri]|uniref:Sulfotransferase n=1 Tax=Chlamydomonas schloesseri TaxID=2026947 RepID=A0A835T3X8_9CHLO|nr:hypothetical protein HYH02_011020 [Chlamydomonas schloesseri]|eukprot:KAG2438323.1 hypothetical protein HYH02_011020 [Chlamydomonas schloesseri]
MAQRRHRDLQLCQGGHHAHAAATLMRANVVATLMRANVVATLMRANAAATLMRANVAATLMRANVAATLMRANVAATLMRANVAATLMRANVAATLMRANAAATLMRANAAATLMRANVVATLMRANVAATLMRANAAATLMRANVAATLMRANAAATLMRANVAATLMRANVAATLMRANVAATLMRANVAATLMRANVAATLMRANLVGQLITGGDPAFNTAAASPWLDLRVVPKEAVLGELEAQAHRRFIKTHLPVDCLPYHPAAKYIYLVRDGRDMCWSLYNHHSTANDMWYSALNETPGRVGPPITRPHPDPRTYFLDWMEQDGGPHWWPFFSHVRGWWEVRSLPNVLLVHFNALRADLKREAHRIARFLGIDVPEDKWPVIMEHCSMDWMRAHAELAVPGGGIFWEHGASDFIFKGTNGRWKDTLTEQDCAAYEERALQELGPECAEWLKSGKPHDSSQFKH